MIEEIIQWLEVTHPTIQYCKNDNEMHGTQMLYIYCKGGRVDIELGKNYISVEPHFHFIKAIGVLQATYMDTFEVMKGVTDLIKIKLETGVKIEAEDREAKIRRLQVEQSNRGPQPGEHYLHYKGGRYVVFAKSICEERLVPLVHYRNYATGWTWTRTLEAFQGVTTNDRGQSVYRFTLIENNEYRANDD